MNNINYDTASSNKRAVVQRYIDTALGSEQSYLVEHLIATSVFDWEDIANYTDESEVMQWYVIERPSVADSLKSIGEVVLENEYGVWWGRQCFGQSIVLDATFWTVLFGVLDDDIKEEVIK